MTKTFTLEMAIEVARADYNNGIMDAMEQLNKYGIDTHFYWDWLGLNGEDPDYNNGNITARDKQYELLGFKEIMNKAYEIVWE